MSIFARIFNFIIAVPMKECQFLTQVKNFFKTIKKCHSISVGLWLSILHFFISDWLISVDNSFVIFSDWRNEFKFSSCLL